MKYWFTFLLFINVLSFNVFGQPTDDQIQDAIENASYPEVFATAQSLMDDNYYQQALKIWLELLDDDPQNANLNYKVGYCYINSEAEKYKAYDYFKKAAVSTVKNYNPYFEDEKAAPYEAMFYYAKALHTQGDIDKAEIYFKEFLDNSHRKNFLRPQAELALIQIKNARKLLKSPKDYVINNLGTQTNTPFAEYSPVVSLDGKILFFTSRRIREDSSNYYYVSPEDGGHFEDVYYSLINDEGKWQEPKLLNFSNYDQNEATVSVSADGQVIYVYKDEGGQGNLYYSQMVDTTFTELEGMPGEVNSTAWETHLTITPDGNTIYFVSDREGGEGGRDIWRVTKLPNGEWSKAFNPGPPLNTPYDEESPFIGSDSKTMYFSSNGEKSMGGFDMMVTQLDENLQFSDPENMGVPLNSFGDDLFYTISADGFTGYYSSVKNDGFGEKDIYMVQSKDSYIRNVAILKGFIVTSDGSRIPDDIVITVKDLSVSGPDKYFSPRRLDGGYVLNLVPCQDYYVEYTLGDKVFYETRLEVPCKTSYQEINRVINLDMASLKGTAEEYNVAYNSLGGKRWQLKKLGYNDSYIGTKVLFSNDDQLLFEETLNKFGEFPYRKLDDDKIYLIKVKNNEDEYCGEMELKLLDDDNKIIKMAVQVNLCEFVLNEKDSTTTEDNISSLTGESKKLLSYIQYFGYNKNILQKEKEYNSFITSLSTLLNSGEEVNVKITGSASKVPTRKYKTNQKLADKRAKEAKNKLLSELKDRGVSVRGLKIETIGIVQGPEFKNDANQQAAAYKKYQYIKVNVE